MPLPSALPRPLTRRRVLAAAALAVGVIPATALATPPAGHGHRPATTSTATAAPAFAVTAAPTGVQDDAGEPGIGLDTTTGAALFGGDSRTHRVDLTSTPATWTDVTPQTAQVTSLDPILFTDQATGRTFNSQLLGACSAMSFSDDGGRSWTPSQGCGVGTAFDHQSVGGGPYPAGGLARPLTSYPDAVYYCAQADLTATCARSDTGGLTFGPGVPVYNAVTDGCAGLHGHLRVGPDGYAYLPNFDCGGHVAVAVSGDAGTTWTVHPVPFSTTQDESDPSVAVGKDGTVYLAWEDGASDATGSTAEVAVSHDHGATWSLAYTAPGIQNVQFPEVVAGDAGRAAISFLGSTTGGSDQVASFPGTFDLYTAMTYDGGATWSTSDATPGDPVQRGGISLGGAGTSGSTTAQRNLLDFDDIALDRHGRVLVAFADGCTGGCVSDPAQNTYTAKGTIARQVAGRTLYAAYDAAGGAAAPGA